MSRYSVGLEPQSGRKCHTKPLAVGIRHGKLLITSKFNQSFLVFALALMPPTAAKKNTWRDELLITYNIIHIFDRMQIQCRSKIRIVSIYEKHMVDIQAPFPKRAEIQPSSRMTRPGSSEEWRNLGSLASNWPHWSWLDWSTQPSQK